MPRLRCGALAQHHRRPILWYKTRGSFAGASPTGDGQAKVNGEGYIYAR